MSKVERSFVPGLTHPTKVHHAGQKTSGALALVVRLVRETAREYSEDDVPHLGSSLAYYTVFSMAPVLVIAVAIAGFVFGPEAATGQLQTQLTGLMGDAGAQVVGDAIAKSSQLGAGIAATIIGVGTLLLGASGAFLELQTALNRVWGCKAVPHAGWANYLRRRFVSFGMVLVIGFLLVVSTVLTAAITGLSEWAGGRLEIPAFALQSLNFGTSFLITTVLFALIYKVLPDAKVAWGDVWIGATLTSVMFAIGKLGIGLYLGHSTIASTFGAAASLVVLLVWVYYSSQMLLIGAEFTQVWSRTRGSRSREPGGDRCVTVGAETPKAPVR